MGHRVALLRDGILQQVDTPTTIYNRPRNLFVAAFIGAPTMNLFYAELAGINGEAAVKLGATTLAVSPAATAQRPGLSRYAGRRIVVGFRPEDVFDATLREDLARTNRIIATVDLVEALGSDVLVHFGIEAQAAQVVSSDSLQQIKASHTGAASPAVARLTPRSDVRLGAAADLSIDTERLHFFDPESGEAIWD
jgi:multiple sugar transport system ATP-binding protein